MGFKDKSGDIKTLIQDDHQYMSDCMHFFNSFSGKTSTYKYALFKAILDNLFNVDQDYRLSFSYLAYSFSKMYWNLVCKYQLPQFQSGRKSLIEIQIDAMMANKPQIQGIDFDSLHVEIQRAYLSKTSFIISKDVMGALYDELNQSIYGFSKARKEIYFSKSSYKFLMKYKSALEDLNYYAWILWMENILKKREKEEGNLAIKLDESTKRESLEVYKKDLIVRGDELRCFYCGKVVTSCYCHMDHFILWSFVKDDQEWNLVFFCPHCNESKNNKLPNKNPYLNKLITRNEHILHNSYEQRLRLLYQSAQYNGLTLWI